MTLRFGILGAGRIGQVHADGMAAVPAAKLVAVADPFADAAKAMQDKHGCDTRTIEEIEASDDIDAVVICTPTDTHADLIERFARAGKAVFCEKPIDLSIERVKDCLKVVEETGTFLMVGFQRRFEPDFNVLKNAIDDGRIGAVEMITLTSRDPGPPPYEYIERCGGIFRDMTIHDFDVARWLLDEDVETVQAAGSVLVDPKIGELGDFDSANVSPLGAGALAGSGVLVDREYVANLLNFKSIYENSLDAVSNRDFIAEFLFNASLIMMHFSKISEEIILTATNASQKRWVGKTLTGEKVILK